MKISYLWKKPCCAINALHLADKCLLVFMLVLMVQSAHNLFFHELAMHESNSFDVIVRTTAAAIFGYFMSANFQNGGRDSSENERRDKNQPARRNCLQILVVAVIGLSSLLLLVIAHNYFLTSSMAAATISQLRDFVSGSVGFLIGHSTHSTQSPRQDA